MLIGLFLFERTMFYLKLILPLLILISLVISEERLNYEGYKLIQLKPKTAKQVHLLGEWHDDPDFDVWNRIKGLNNEVDVGLSPESYLKYKRLFDAFDFDYKILNDNIQNQIDEQLASMAKSRLGDVTRVAGTYARHTNINIWLEMIAAANFQYASTYVAGKTYENRELKVFKLKTATSKRAIWIDCGIHAREWLSPSTCIWFIDKITRDYNAGDPLVREILGYYEIHILPVLNADGYDYTFESGKRLWRKNKFPNVNAGTCIGVDINRNFGFQWMVAGASNNPCSETYAGSSPNDQLETQAVQKAILNQPGQWDAFITLHTYGQWFFTEWSYSNIAPADYTLQKETADLAAAAIKSVSNTEFVTGSCADLLYLAAGCSADWAYGNASIVHSYTIELRPCSDVTKCADGYLGFMLPEDRVPLVGQETYVGLKALMKKIKP